MSGRVFLPDAVRSRIPPSPFFGEGIGTDLDGILVHDHASGGGPGTPYLVPRARPVPLIATGRPESSRAATEALLRSLGARWARLEMLPDGVPLTARSAAGHKARHDGRTRLGLFVESCPEQAEMIFEMIGRPVACPIIEKVFQ